MTARAWIALQKSDATGHKHFRVIYPNRKVTLRKQQSLEYTVGGKPDIGQGSIQEIHEYVIRVRYDEPTGDYGDLLDLRAFYELNNPNGTPSCFITMLDHHETSKTVLFIGNFSDSILGCEIEGTDAWFLVECVFHVIP